MSEEKDTKKPKATLIKHQKSSTSNESGSQEKKRVVVVKKKKKTPKPVAVTAEKKESSKAESPRPSEEKKKDSEKPVKSSETAASGEKKPAASGRKPAASGSAGSGPRAKYDGNAPRQAGRPVSRYRADNAPRQAGNYRPGTNRQEGTSAGGGGARTGGYQGRSNDRQGQTGGYRGNSGDGNRTGGYQGRSGGYQGRGPGSRPATGSGGGYQGRTGGPRPGGGRPGAGRPGGGRPGAGGGRPGGGRPGAGGGRTETTTPVQGKSAPKKFKSKSKKSFVKKKEFVERDYSSFNKKKTINNTNPVPKEIDIMEVITVSELARKMNLKASDLISKLMGMGMMVTINQQIDADTATLLAEEYECKVNLVSLYDETIIETEEDKEEDLKPRAPIVTVMGHVDHGKTKLLDAIRSANVVDGEFGGITQHIGAYTVDTEKGKITFLDTPGHSAFTMMRARGAQITDVVILVVAANDGVMPQTKEAVAHAKEAGVPIVVAVNKTDLPEANPDRVKQQLSELDILSEDWGGSVQFISISALKKTGIQELLDAVHLEAEMLDLKANWDCRAEGKVVESKVDQGRGTVSTILVERGVLRVGDAFVAGVFNGKIRAMFDDKGNKLTEAPPSTPVEILGISGVPNSGDPFQVTASEKEAKQYSAKRLELRKVEDARNVKKITLDNLYDSIQEGTIQELKVIIKGDVHGSVEALQSALEKLSTKEIRLVCIRAGAGAIIEDDVYLASASNAIIVGFHVRPTAKALAIADVEKVDIRKYNIIYDAVEDIRSAMEGMLAPDLKEEVTGTVEIRETFKVPKIGVIAGCMVTSGVITRKGQVHVYRDGVEVHTGVISSLKRFKDDAKEVREGFECGLSIDNFQDIQVGDLLEVFVIKEVARKLEDNKDSE